MDKPNSECKAKIRLYFAQKWQILNHLLYIICIIALIRQVGEASFITTNHNARLSFKAKPYFKNYVTLAIKLRRG